MIALVNYGESGPLMTLQPIPTDPNMNGGENWDILSLMIPGDIAQFMINIDD